MKLYIKLLLHIIILYSFSLQSTQLVTYTLSQGRFGDQLLAYAKAHYISFLYTIPLCYTPFKHAELLNLSSQNYTHQQARAIEITVEKDTIVPFDQQTHTSYAVCLSTKHGDITNLDSLALYALKNNAYKKDIQKLFTPRVQINSITWPTDCLTVALHVRKPSGYDTSLRSIQQYQISDYKNIAPTVIEKKNNSMPSDKRYPHKFPPDQYYIDQLNFIADLFPHKKIYAYLFTDYQDPAALVALYIPHLKNNILLVCHNSEQQTYMRFIDDFYNMAQSMCLIRASSNFSRAAQLLGNHQLVLYPKSTHWYTNAVIVDCVWLLGITKDQKEFKLSTYNSFEPTVEPPFLSFIQALLD